MNISVAAIRACAMLLAGGLAFSLMSCLAAQEPDAGQLAALDVSVLDSVSGSPVSGARVSLTPQSQGDSVSITSGAGGSVAFRNLKPGSYTLFARKDGYMLLNYGATSNRQPATPVLIEAGKQPRKIVYRLVPNGLISGKVLDSNGEPVAGAALAIGEAPTYGELVVMEITPDKTSESGDFRISLPSPGSFYLLAIPPARARGAKTERALSPAFFPASREVSGAAPVTVLPGRDAAGIRITLRETPLYAVRGKLTALPPEWAARDVELLLIPKVLVNASAFIATQQVYRLLGEGSGNRGVQPDGAFEFATVEPGLYEIFAYRSGRAQRKPDDHFGRLEVNVTDHDIEGVELPYTGPLRLTWRIRAAGKALADARCSVILNPADGDTSPNAAMDKDGNITMETVVRGRYWPNLMCSPSTIAIESATLSDSAGAVDIMDRELDLRGVSNNAVIDVALRPKSAVVSGVVKEGDALVPRMWVTLIPEPAGRARMLRFRAGWADDSGRFSISGVAPGEYRLYAWREALAGAYFLEPSFLQRYESQATKVSVNGDGAISVEAAPVNP